MSASRASSVGCAPTAPFVCSVPTNLRCPPSMLPSSLLDDSAESPQASPGRGTRRTLHKRSLHGTNLARPKCRSSPEDAVSLNTGRRSRIGFPRASCAKAILAAIFAILLLAAPAQAHAGHALLSAARTLTAPAPASCPAGVPVQAISVVNQAHVSRLALARVENAVVAQSLQLRAAWGTPCVQFAPGGWPLYLEPRASGWALHYAPDDTGIGSFADDTACSHRPDLTMPCALVSLDPNWTIRVSHEVLETLADPGGQGQEICDPVEDWSYRVDGVWVSDFVFPNGHRDQLGVLG